MRTDGPLRLEIPEFADVETHIGSELRRIDLPAAATAATPAPAAGRDWLGDVLLALAIYLLVSASGCAMLGRVADVVGEEAAHAAGDALAGVDAVIPPGADPMQALAVAGVAIGIRFAAALATRLIARAGAAIRDRVAGRSPTEAEP